MAKKSDSKKDLLKKAAGDAVRKSLSGEPGKSKPEPEAKNSESIQVQSLSLTAKSSESELKRSESEPFQTQAQSQVPKPEEPKPVSSSRIENGEKQLPKKEPLSKVHNGMRIEEYTQTGPRESNGNKKWIRILGIFFLVLFVWWIWPPKHEIYMDVDKMTPDKVSGMTSEKEYHFTHGQDFFIYYKRGGWFSPDKVKLTIYKVGDSREEVSVQEKDFKRRIEKFQTYYDDSFFDEEGAYEVEIKNEEDEVLSIKKFTID